MDKPFKIVNEAKKLRAEGYSYEEIGKKFTISKSTAYYWTKDIRLNNSAKERIKIRERRGFANALKAMKNKRESVILDISNKVKQRTATITYNNNIKRLICAILYWAEGEKSNHKRVTFINSDPIMVKAFLKLFRASFNLDETKFRVLVHIHEYHNNEEIKRYWSQITEIPLVKFNKSYLKKHTKKRVRPNFMGTVSIRYHDYKIALELYLIYNMFAKSLI